MRRAATTYLAAYLAAGLCIASTTIAYAQKSQESRASAATATSTNAAAQIPLADLLTSLSISLGVSYIYDSRIVDDKFVAPIAIDSDVNSELTRILGELDLSLKKVNRRTYAIAHSPAKGAAATRLSRTVEPDHLPALPDVILVKASLADNQGRAWADTLFDVDYVDLQYSTVFETSDAIQSVPQLLASISPANTALLGPSAGLSFVDLRGLGVERSIVLIDGTQRTSMPGGNDTLIGFDLNFVAEPFLKSIEVDARPGGARYGAGASVGAVNFVTWRNLDRAFAGAKFGVSERGDSERVSLYAVGGRDLDQGAGNVTFGVNLVRREGLIGADRAETSTHYGRPRAQDQPLTPGAGGSPVTPLGSVSGALVDGVLVNTQSFRRLVRNADGSFEPFIGAPQQLYNFAAEQNSILPADKALGFFSAEWRATPILRLFADLRGGIVSVDGRIAPLPASRALGFDPVTGDAIVIPIDHSTIPTALRDALISRYGDEIDSIVFDRRFAELGPRRYSIDRTLVDATFGLEFDDPEAVATKLTYRFGRAAAVSRNLDRVDGARLAISIDEEACAAVLGCAPADFFAPGGLSPSTLAFIVAPTSEDRFSITEHEIAATSHLRRTLDDEGSVRLFGGAALKRAALNVDNRVQDGVVELTELRTAEHEGVLTTFDAFWGADITSLDMFGLGRGVDASVSARLTQSPTFGAAWNFEGALGWAVNDAVALKGFVHIGDRPPNIVELFGQGTFRKSPFADPCGLLNVDSTETLRENCFSDAALGVGPDFRQIHALSSQTLFGDPNLRPEDNRTWSVGVGVEPTAHWPILPGRLTLSASWIDIRIRNLIALGSSPLVDCFESDKFSDAACGINPRTGRPLIQRDPLSRQIVGVDNLLTNQGGRDWRGLDLDFTYRVEPTILGPIDRISVSGLHTYTHRSTSLAPGVDALREEGLVDFPRHRSLITAVAQTGPMSVAAFIQRRGKVLTNREFASVSTIPAHVTADIAVRYSFDRATLEIGVDNVTDRNPPIVAFGETFSTFPEYYDLIGRRFSISLETAL